MNSDVTGTGNGLPLRNAMIPARRLDRRARRSAPLLLSAAAAATAAAFAPAALAGTVQTLTSGANLDVAADFTPSANVPNVGNDVLIAPGFPLAASALNLSTGTATAGEAITFGSLNDTNLFAVTVRNAVLNGSTGTAAATLTLGGGGSTDAVTGANAADLIYVATGATLNTSSSTSTTSTTGGILSLALGQSGNFDVVGTSTLGSNLSTGGFTVTKTGAGTLTGTGNLVLGTGGGLAVAAGTLTQSATVSGAGMVTVNAGLLNLSGTNTYTGGTTINAGGTVTTTSARSAGTGFLNLSGGTFQYSNATLTSPATAFVPSVLNLVAGTSVFGIVNTSTTAGARVNLGIGSVIAGTGGITLAGSTLSTSTTGASSLQYSAANTYTGPTNVPLGQTLVLNVAGSATGSALNLSGGSLFLTTGRTATGTFASVTLAAGASAIDVLAANNTSAGTIATTSSLGALTHAAGGTVDFTLLPTTGTLTTTTAAPNGGGIVGGFATVGGGAAFAAVDPTTGALSAFNAASTDYTTTAAPDFDANTGGQFTGTATVNSLRFNAPGAVAADLNGQAFTVATGGVLVTPTAAAGGTSITDGTLTSGNGADLAFQVYNTTAPLTVTAGVTGAIGITKSGGGTLILDGATTVTGPTALNAGNLQVGTGDTGGGISLSSSVVEGAGTGLSFNRSDDLTFSGNISGPGTLTKNGPDTLTLTGTNTYTAGATFNGGTVSVTTTNALGTTASQTTLNAATLLFTAGTSTPTTRTFGLNNAASTFSSSTTAATVFLNGVISGTGALNKAGVGNIFLGNSGNTFTGGIDVQAGTLSIGSNGVFGGASGTQLVTVENAGILQFNATNFLTGTFGAANTVVSSGRTFALNGAGSQVAVTGAETWTIQGVIRDGTAPGTLNKTNTGSIYLTNVNTYSGGTNVNAGVVRANGGTNNSTGSGVVTVNAGGTLGGTGLVAGPVVVNAGGTITAGSSSTTFGTFNTSGGETWNGGGRYLSKINAAMTSTDRLVMSSLAVNASSGAAFTITLSNTSTGTTLTAGTVYVLATDLDASDATNPFSGTNFANTSSGLVLATTTGVTVPSTFALSEQADATSGYDLILTDAVGTPEPTSLLLLAVAAGPLALGRRRRRSTADAV